MRKLTTPDVFSALRLVQKSGLKEELTKLIKDIADKDMTDIKEVGITGLLSVLEVFSAEQCENLIYEWLSGPLEIPAEDIRTMDLDVFVEMVQTLAKENNLKNFFKALSGLISKQR